MIKNILKEDYEQKLKDARKDEKERTEKHWKEKLNENITAFEKEYELMLADKDAKIQSLEDQLGKEKRNSKEAKEVYYFAYEQVKKNLEVATQLKIKIKIMFDKVQEIYQDAITIFDRAELLNKEMENTDSINRDKLKLPHLKNKKK